MQFSFVSVVPPNILIMPHFQGLYYLFLCCDFLFIYFYTNFLSGDQKSSHAFLSPIHDPIYDCSGLQAPTLQPMNNNSYQRTYMSSSVHSRPSVGIFK
jgi:hypothetical protein